MHTPSCWIFCTVIDNFGDIGVSWRLAQEIRRRLNYRVYLWLDDSRALQALVPDSPPLPCRHHGIFLRSWQEGLNADLDGAAEPDLLIETFACTLPPAVHDIIRRRRPVWLNWEYLSAEDWAVRTHAMPSLQADGTEKYFWQMGFCPQGGGLLREADYLKEKQDFEQNKIDNFCQQLGLDRSGSLNIFAFGYRSPVWRDWAETLAEWEQPIRLWLAGTQIADSLNGFQGGNLSLHRLPFVPQAEFDRLLWAADMLWVRGEDSFVRAQLAGKPFFWHIYPQQEMAHLDKLDAFWRQAAPSDPVIRQAHQQLSWELNGALRLTAPQRREYWHTLLQSFSDWQQAAQQWQQSLLQQSDAVSRLQQWLHKQAA